MDGQNIPHGGPEMLRAYIHEMASLVRVHAEIAMKHAEVGDDTALEYATRRWVAYTKAALATMTDLKAMKETGRVP